MKKIGIIFAMKEELDEVLKTVEVKNKYHFWNLTVYETQRNNNCCFLVESGIGKVNAARTTQILIDKLEVEEILNVGVAGGIAPSIKVGDIIIATELVQYDFDLTAFGREKGEIPNIGRKIQCNKKMLEIVNKTKMEFTKGIIASGDRFVDNKKTGQSIYKEFNALCVEMEGAAIAQVCCLSNVAFLVLRAISDSTEQEENKITYDEFLESSSKKIAQFLNQYLDKIK